MGGRGGGGVLSIVDAKGFFVHLPNFEKEQAIFNKLRIVLPPRNIYSLNYSSGEGELRRPYRSQLASSKSWAGTVQQLPCEHLSGRGIKEVVV